MAAERRLDNLVIEETSWVDHSANVSSGWIVVKAEGAADDEPPQNDAALLAVLSDLRDRADALAAGFEDIARRAEAVAAARTTPEPPPPPKKPAPKTPTEKMADATGTYRSHVLGSERGIERLAETAAVLRRENPRLSAEEARHKAVAGALGTTGVSATIDNVAKALVEGGTAPGEARVAAARTVSDDLHRQLSVRKTGRREIDPAVADSAAAIKVARILKGWSQQQLADAVGTSVTSVSEWETGDHAPTGLFASRLASVLGDGPEGRRELATQIAKAREGR